MASKRAKTKLNKKAAILLLATVGSAVVVGGVSVKLMRKKESPAKWEALTQAALQQGNWVEAFENQRRVSALQPSPEALQKQGEIAKAAAAQDPKYIFEDRRAFEQALATNPRFLPSLRSLTQWYIDFLSNEGLKRSPNDYARLRELATTTLTVDPADKRAAALIPSSYVMAWLRGIDTTPDALTKALADLDAIMAKDPFDAETLGVLTNAYMRQASNARREGREQDSTKLFAKAVNVMKASIKAADDSLASAGGPTTAPAFGTVTQPDAEVEKREVPALLIYFRGVTVFSVLRQVDKNGAAGHQRDWQLAADAAMRLARPNRAWFREIYHTSATLAMMRRDRPAAEAIYKHLLEQGPNDVRSRLIYAAFLRQDPEKIDEAIEILSRAGEVQSQNVGSFVALELSGDILRTKRTLIDYRLAASDMAAKANDVAKSTKLLEAAGLDAQKLLSDAPEDPIALLLMGRVELMRGHSVPSIGYFTRARTVFDQRPEERRDEYWDLLRQLSGAYLKTGQTGMSKKVLVEVLALHPEDTAARLQLLEIHRQLGEMADARAQLSEAKRQIAEAKKRDPSRVDPLEALVNQVDVIFNAADIIIKNAATDGATTAPSGDSLKVFNELPEMTRPERLSKARFAMGARLNSEATRLLQLVYAEDQKDTAIAIMLVQSLVAEKKLDEARTTVKMAREAKPDDLQLKMFELQLNGAKPAELQQAYLDEITKTPDEFDRNMKLYEFYVMSDRAKALEFLKRAAALKPSDLKVNDRLFQNALADRKYDEAEQYIPALAAGNADEVKGKLFRFQLASARGQKDAATALATELTLEYAQFAESWNTLASAQMAQGNVEGANRSFAQTLARQPNNLKALKGQIQTLYLLGKPEDAGRAINDALRVTAQMGAPDEELVEYKILHELTQGDTVKALQAVEKMVAAAPADRLDIRAKLGVAYSQAAGVAAGKGDTASAHERADKAIAGFDAVLSSLPPMATVATMTQEQRSRVPDPIALMSQIARVAPLATNPLSAEPALKKAIDNLPPTAAEPVMVLAEYYGMVGKGAEAEASAREGVRRGGGSAAPRRSAAVILARVNKVDDAISMLDGITDPDQKRQSTAQRVEMLLRAKRAEEAEKIDRAAIQADPNDVTLQVLLAAILVETSRFDEAGRQVTAILAREPSNINALYYRARVQLGMPSGDLSSAVRDLQFIRDNSNISEERRRWLIEAYRRTGDIDAVGREGKVLLKADPTNYQLRMQLVEAYLRTSPPSLVEASNLIDEGLQQPTLAKNPDVLMVKARIAIDRKDFPTAISAAKAAVEASNRDPRAMAEYLSMLVTAKMPKDVLTESDPLIAAGTKDHLVYIARGGAKKQLGENAGALSDYLAALKLAAENDSTGSASMQVAASMGDTLGVDAAIQGIAPQLDANAQNRVSTALLYQTKGRLPEALIVLEPALAKVDAYQPLEQVALLRTGGGLLVTPGTQQDFARSVLLYKKLILLRPNDLNTLNNLAFVLSEKLQPPQLAEAKQYSTRAVQVLAQANSVDPLVLDTHGWVLVLSGEVQEGLLILTRAAQLRSFAEVHYHLGEAYRRLSMPEQALDEAKKAERELTRPGADPSYGPKVTELKRAAEEDIAKKPGR